MEKTDLSRISPFPSPNESIDKENNLSVTSKTTKRKPDIIQSSFPKIQLEFNHISRVNHQFIGNAEE